MLLEYVTNLYLKRFFFTSLCSFIKDPAFLGLISLLITAIIVTIIYYGAMTMRILVGCIDFQRKKRTSHILNIL